MLDPPQQLSPEQSGQEEFVLQLLPGETTSALHKNQGTRIGSCSVFQQQLTEAGVCGRRQAAERGGKRRAVCSHQFCFFFMLSFLALFKKIFNEVFLKHCAQFHSILSLWNSTYCVFVLIAGFGTPIKQMIDTEQIKSVVRSYVGSSGYHSQDTFVQEGTPSWLGMLQEQKLVSWRKLCC